MCAVATVAIVSDIRADTVDSLHVPLWLAITVLNSVPCGLQQALLGAIVAWNGLAGAIAVWDGLAGVNGVWDGLVGA